jgi:glycosyltransferase involved in cell wall biosynthesis
VSQNNKNIYRLLLTQKTDDLNQFLKESANFTIDFTYEAEYNKTSFYEDSYFSPPMPFSFGCIHCFDLGPVNKIVIDTESGEFIHEFKNELEPIRFKVLIDNQNREVKLFQDKDIIPTRFNFSGKLKYEKEIAIGKGYFKRIWKGCFINFDISITKKGGQKLEINALQENKFFKKESYYDYHKPIVSLIIPVYNSEKYILQSINSAVNQDYQNLDIVIVNDYTLDNSIELIKQNFSDKRIRFINNFCNKGVSGARNSGILSSIGDYICFLDSDDYLDANSISKRADHLTNHLDHHFVFCRTSLVDSNRNKLNWVLEAKPELTYNDFHSNYIHTNSIMIRKSKLGKILYDESKTNGEDWLFHAQIARLGHRWIRVNGTKAYYRQNNATVRSDIIKHEKKLNEILEKLYSIDTSIDLRITHPNYKEITSIDINLVKLKRYISLLFYLGFSTPHLTYVDLNGKYDKLEYWNSSYLSSQVLLNLLKFATCRFFLCKTDNYEDYALTFKQGLLSFLANHLKEDKYNFILNTLGNFLARSPKNTVEVIQGNATNILLYPEINDQEKFNREVLRLCWYLFPIKDRISNLFINSIYKDITSVPFDFDPHTLDCYKGIKSKIQSYDINKLNIRLKYVLCWSLDHLNELELILKNVKYEKIVKVDSLKNQYAASYYLKLSSEYSHEIRLKNRLESKSKFKLLTSEITSKNYEKSFIFGTGPNLSELDTDKYEFESSLTIACNSMVKDKKLLKKINPDIFIAADPIFHAGCSSYAKAFRDELRICLNAFPKSFFIVPERDLPLHLSQFPKIDPNRIIGIPFKNEIENNFNLIKDFYVKTYSNVLTLFLLPIAATFTRKILISGCDGKETLNNRYFWSHNKDVQFETEMHNIKKAHPSFFDINYDKYYLEHCDNLKNQIEELLHMNYSIKNLTLSNIPILKTLSKK